MAARTSLDACAACSCQIRRRDNRAHPRSGQFPPPTMRGRLSHDRDPALAKSETRARFNRQGKGRVACISPSRPSQALPRSSVYPKVRRPAARIETVANTAVQPHGIVWLALPEVPPARAVAENSTRLVSEKRTSPERRVRLDSSPTSSLTRREHPRPLHGIRLRAPRGHSR